jgi:hypothetical protein
MADREATVLEKLLPPAIEKRTAKYGPTYKDRFRLRPKWLAAAAAIVALSAAGSPSLNSLANLTSSSARIASCPAILTQIDSMIIGVFSVGPLANSECQGMISRCSRRPGLFVAFDNPGAAARAQLTS